MPDQTTTTPEVTAPPAVASETAPAASPEAAPAPDGQPSGLTSMADALKGFDDIGLSATDGLDSKPRRSIYEKDAVKKEGGEDKSTKPKPQPPVEHQFQPDQNARAPKLAKITDPADRERLGKMSNEAFNKYYKLTLDLQEGNLVPKSKLDEAVAAKVAEFESQKAEALSSRYFDHEEGYRLTPEYRQIENAVTQLGQERGFWSQQLSNIRSKKPFKILELDASGKPKPSDAEYDPNDETAEGHVISKITQATAMIEDRRRAMQTIPTQHKELHSKFTGVVTHLDKSIFDGATAPAFLEKTKAYLGSFPTALRERPEIQLIAKALAGGELLLARVKQLEESATRGTNVSKALATSAPAPLETAAAAGSEDNTAAAVRQLDRIASQSGSFY